MDIKFIFNHNYVSCKAYFKMSVVIENKGMFMVVYNYATKKVQCQKVDSTKNYYKLVHGSHPVSYSDIDSVIKEWNNFDKVFQEAYIKCFDYLYVAFIKFKTLNVLTPDELKETRTIIHEARDKFFAFINSCSASTESISEQTSEVIEAVNEELKRNCVPMAKIINDNNLNEVVSGNFYSIIDVLSFNGNDYVTLDINGEHRTLNKNRLKLLTVFTDKPC